MQCFPEYCKLRGFCNHKKSRFPHGGRRLFCVYVLVKLFYLEPQGLLHVFAASLSQAGFTSLSHALSDAFGQGLPDSLGQSLVSALGHVFGQAGFASLSATALLHTLAAASQGLLHCFAFSVRPLKITKAIIAKIANFTCVFILKTFQKSHLFTSLHLIRIVANEVR